MLLRTLRWGGDEKEEKSYESWLSPIIRVNRTPKRMARARL